MLLSGAEPRMKQKLMDAIGMLFPGTDSPRERLALQRQALLPWHRGKHHVLEHDELAMLLLLLLYDFCRHGHCQ